MALLTMNEAKDEIGMDREETDFDDIIELLSTAVQSLFEQLTDRKYESAVFTEYYNADKFQDRVFLKNFPVNSITTVHDDPDREFGSDTLVEADDYTFDGDNGVIYFDGWVSSGKQSIKVVYEAGYSVDTFPDGLKEVFLRQVAAWFQDSKNNEQAVSSVTTPGGSMVKKELSDNLLPDFKLMVDISAR